MLLTQVVSVILF